MRTVLVVDDEVDVRQLLSTYLDLQGFTVYTANNGREALSRLDEIQPGLILLDLMMPVMDGVEFRRRQQENPRWREIPVVCISAKHDAPAIAETLNVEACVTKPFDIDYVSELVRQHCQLT